MDQQIKSDNFEEDFLLKNLPDAQGMLSLTLPNKDMLYYPTVSNQISVLKAFDFSSQKNLNEDDDFISIDTKSTIPTQSKARNKQGKKNMGSAFSQSQKPRNATQNKNQYSSPHPKFKVNQTINQEGSWKIIADFNKLTLEKLRLEPYAEIDNENIFILGKIFQYSQETEDKASVFTPLTLEEGRALKFFGNVTTMDDERIKEGSDFADIYITDKILSVIMTSVYNSHPWHLKITKLGDNIFIDQMENSMIDLVTVNESDNTLYDEDEKSVNSYKSLCIEATLINEYIKEQMVDKESEQYEANGENPFKTSEMKDEEIENLGYIYRLWNVDDLDVFVRCQVHAYEENDDGNKEFVNIHALNEYDKNSFLGKDSNLLPILLKKEIQSNYLKIAKWGVCAYLAGVKKLKIGFVTRKNTKEKDEHLISGFYEIKTDDILKITNFNNIIAWGIFKEIIDLIRRQKDDGFFILMKTIVTSGAKSQLKLYKVPESTFKTEE